MLVQRLQRWLNIISRVLGACLQCRAKANSSTVTAYLKRKQLFSFSFARHYSKVTSKPQGYDTPVEMEQPCIVKRVIKGHKGCTWTCTRTLLHNSHQYTINLFTTIHDGNFRRHSSMNVTIK